MCRHGNSLNTSEKPRLAQFISMSPTPRDVTPAERKDAAAERVRKWSEKVVGLGNAPGDARPDPYEGRTPAAELTELGKKIVGVEPWPGLPFE